MPRQCVFAVFLAQLATSVAITTSPASALELVWSDGSKDVAVVVSRPCTLLVRTTRASEVLPRAWHLSWTAVSNAVFETNVYRIRDSQDTLITLGWYPTMPEQAKVGCTMVGSPTVVAVEEGAAQGADFAVAVRPNPVRRQAWIDLSLPHAGIVDLEVFDLAGRRVATLLQGPFGPGRHSATWDGRGPRSRASRAGVYYLRCGFAGREIVRRLVLLGVGR